MSDFNKTVKHLSHLAKIDLENNEAQGFAKDLEDILTHIDAINSLDIQNIKPSIHPIEISNVFREDTPSASIDKKAVLKASADSDSDYFIVPSILGENDK